MKTKFSRLKQNGKNRITNIKNKAQNGFQKFKENFEEAKNKPRSKRKFLLLGFTTVVGIFGVTLLAPVLPAIAKDIPQKGPSHDKAYPSPPPGQSSPQHFSEVQSVLSGAAMTLCVGAVNTGAFVLGALCGLVVVAGVLITRDKK